jgi:dihydropteroate synthase
MMQADCIKDGRWAGLARRRALLGPAVMGIVNVTPDSFSDGGLFDCADAAIKHGLALLSEGANILDIGGESTRPGAIPVSPDQEQQRILPVIAALAAPVRQSGGLISVDTRNSQTMATALAVGADIVNDVSALTHDSYAMSVVARAGCPVILMHMQGRPESMQENPYYVKIIEDIVDWLKQRIEDCIENGIARDRIWVDPGVGFGKTIDHNLEILANIARFQGLASGTLLGVSRKSFIATITNQQIAPGNRLPGSLAAMMASLDGMPIAIRVHDVAATCQALAVWQAIEAKKDNRIKSDCRKQREH